MLLYGGYKSQKGGTTMPGDYYFDLSERTPLNSVNVKNVSNAIFN